jgi:hypothetical protein
MLTRAARRQLGDDATPLRSLSLVKRRRRTTNPPSGASTVTMPSREDAAGAREAPTTSASAGASASASAGASASASAIETTPTIFPLPNCGAVDAHRVFQSWRENQELTLAKHADDDSARQDCKQRRLAVRRMMQLHQSAGCTSPVYFLAMNLYDRYSATKSVSSPEVDVLLATCLLLGSKLEDEDWHLTPSGVAMFYDRLFHVDIKEKDVREQEFAVLAKLNFRIGVPQANNFLLALLHSPTMSACNITRCMRILQLLSQAPAWKVTLPLVAACTALRYEVRTANVADTWPDDLALFTGVSTDDMMHLATSFKETLSSHEREIFPAKMKDLFGPALRAIQGSRDA